MRFRDTPLGERLLLWRRRLGAWWHRVTGFGLAVRAAVFVSGTAAIVLAVDGPARLLFVPVAVLLSVMAMALPDGAWVWTVLVTALAGWILSTLTLERASLITAFGVGAAMYIHHASCAIAAAWRADAAVSPHVARDWVTRQTTVLAVSALAVAMTAGLASRPLPLPPESLFVVGILGALSIPIVVVASLSRR